ncbi:MAG: hypothetical protein Q8909_16565 [Bacteroidota bacterium]|nr:hypothetical protein [Bacteroidota bacterium]
METRTLSEILKENILAKYKTIPLHPVTLEDALAIAFKSNESNYTNVINDLKLLFGERTDLSFATIVIKNRRTSFDRVYNKAVLSLIANGRRLSEAKRIYFVMRFGKSSWFKYGGLFTKQGADMAMVYCRYRKPGVDYYWTANFSDPYKKKIALTIIYI